MKQPILLGIMAKPEMHRRIGIGLLFLVGGGCLLANLIAIYLADSINDEAPSRLALLAFSVGLVLAQPFILLIWLILGTGSIWQRFFTCIGFSLASMSLFFLGFSFFAIDVERPLLRQLRVLFLQSPILLFPLFAWGASLPLLAYHLLLGRRFQWQATSPGRAVITIRGILLFMTVTALVLASLQVMILTNRGRPIWWFASIGSGITLLFSFLFMVPAVGRLMRERGFWLWACLWPAALILMTNFIFLAIWTEGFRRTLEGLVLNEVLLLEAFTVSFALAIVTWLGALRLLGYRICRP